MLIGPGKICPGNIFPKTQMVKFARMSIDRQHQISQAFSAAQLAKHHAHQLIPTGKMSDFIIASVFRNDAIKYPLWQKSADLSKDIFSLVHGSNQAKIP